MASKETRVKCSTKCRIKGKGGRKYLFRKLVKTKHSKVLRTRGKLGGVKYERRSSQTYNFQSDFVLIIYVSRRNRQTTPKSFVFDKITRSVCGSEAAIQDSEQAFLA